jgi:hypothetical protein
MGCSGSKESIATETTVVHKRETSTTELLAAEELLPAPTAEELAQLQAQLDAFAFKGT